ALARTVAGRLQAVETFGEAFAAVVGFLQAMALDHRAHCTVDHEDAFGERRFERGDAVGMQPGKGRHLHVLLKGPAVAGGLHGFFAISEITSKCGGRFSRVTVSDVCTDSPALSANL